MADIRDVLRKDVNAISSNSVFVVPNIPSAKLKSAIELHRLSNPSYTVMAICEEDGLLFTDTYVSFRAMFSAPIKIAYSDIATVEIPSGFHQQAVRVLLKKGGEGVLIDNLVNSDIRRLAALLRSCAEHADGRKENHQLISVEATSVAHGATMPSIHDFLRENVGAIAPKKVYIAPNIPANKLKGAIEGHRASGFLGSVIAIYDDTAFGGGEDGLLFTSTHVSYRAMWSDPIKIAYSDIAAVEVNPGLIRGAIRVLLKGGEHKLLDNLDNGDCQRLAALLRSCAECVGAHKENRQPVSVAATNIAQTEAAQDEGVSVGAILAGAVVGVLAVAAAPFTGGGSVLAGATLATSLAGAGGLAAAAGVAGAAAGAGLADQKRKQVAESSFRLAQERVAAGYATKTAALQEALSKAAQRFQEHNEFNNFVLCLIAVGTSMAACDGNVHLEEQSQLREFALGIVSTKLPPTIEKAVSSLMACPPPFEQAMMYVERLGPDVWPHIDAVLAVVSEADGRLTQEEKDFLVKWAEYKLEHKQGEAV